MKHGSGCGGKPLTGFRQESHLVDISEIVQASSKHSTRGRGLGRGKVAWHRVVAEGVAASSGPLGWWGWECR